VEADPRLVGQGGNPLGPQHPPGAHEACWQAGTTGTPSNGDGASDGCTTGCTTAVGRDDGTGDVTGLVRDQERNHLGDLLSVGRAAQRRGLTKGHDPFRLAPSVNTGPGAMAFTRTWLGLNSAAHERVSAASAAIVAL